MNIYNENVFATPNVAGLKNKQFASLPAKTRTKKALDDVKNTVHSRNMESSGNELLKVESICKNPSELKKGLKSPKPSAVKPMPVSFLSDKWDWDIAESCADGCRCQIHLDVNFSDLPEELRLSKSDIDRFATLWSNETEEVTPDTSYDYDQLEDVTNKMRDIWCSLGNSFSESDSFLNLLDESYNAAVPVIAVHE